MTAIKAIRTVRQELETTYDGDATPKYKRGDYLRVYCGPYEDHCFKVAKVRYNYDINAFEYLYDGILIGGWYAENTLVPERVPIFGALR